MWGEPEWRRSRDMVAVVAMCGPGSRPHHHVELALPRVAAADRIRGGRAPGRLIHTYSPYDWDR